MMHQIGAKLTIRIKGELKADIKRKVLPLKVLSKTENPLFWFEFADK